MEIEKSCQRTTHIEKNSTNRSVEHKCCGRINLVTFVERTRGGARFAQCHSYLRDSLVLQIELEMLRDDGRNRRRICFDSGSSLKAVVPNLEGSCWGANVVSTKRVQLMHDGDVLLICLVGG